MKDPQERKRKCSATVEFNSLLYNDTAVSSIEFLPN